MEKADVGRVREEKRREEKKRRRKKKEYQRREEKRKSQKKEDEGARKGRKSRETMPWGSGGSKSRLAKAAGAEQSGQMTDEKLHAVVVRSRFRSQNAKNASCPEQLWKLRCSKSARRCGAKAHLEVKM